MARGVDHRRDVKAKLEVVVGRAEVQSWNWDGDEARGGGGAHDGGGVHPMGGTSAEAAIGGLAQDQCGNRSEYEAASESTYVAVAVVVGLYNVSAAVVVAACAM